MAIFPTKMAFISSNNPIALQIHSSLNVFNVLIHGFSQKFDKICMKTWNSVHFWVFVTIGRNLSLFSLNNCVYFQVKSSRIMNAFLVERLHILIHQVFQKLVKNFIETWKICIFWFFCQFRSEFGAFFQNKKHLSLQRSLLDNDFFPCWTFVLF